MLSSVPPILIFHHTGFQRTGAFSPLHRPQLVYLDRVSLLCFTTAHSFLLHWHDMLFILELEHVVDESFHQSARVQSAAIYRQSIFQVFFLIEV